MLTFCIPIRHQTIGSRSGKYFLNHRSLIDCFPPILRYYKL